MIQFTKHSGIYLLRAETHIPVSLDNAWEFFSSPQNLVKITPSTMGFQITSDSTPDVYAGKIITYKVSPFPGVKMNWVTEITQVRENEFFVDEQRFGPYSMWHHEHHFEERDNGTFMVDLVYYKPPMGAIGRLFESTLIRPRLRQIFKFREESLREIFG